MPMPANKIEDVWKRIAVRGDDECWPFTGAPNTYGYGQMQLNGKLALVHRIVYQLVNGDDPAGKIVCHRCDNPLCCNPAHLFLGTVADNNRDAIEKGRHSHGERHPYARLTDQDVLEIRRQCSEGKPYVSVAAQFGVTPENVSYIAHRQTWKHL